MNKIINILGIIRYLKNWTLFFLDYFHLLKKDMIIYQFRDGTKLITRTGTSDRGLVNAIWIKKEYNRLPEFRIKEDDIIIDVGAHIGIFSIFAAIRAKNGRVYSYEPLLENFKLLQKNISLNSLSNIQCFNLGISGEKGEKEFFINPEGSSYIYSGSKKRKIYCITLEEIFETNKLTKIDFLKLDAEGAEYEILFNTPKEFFEKIDKISMEYHSNSSSLNIKLKNFLENMGFKVIFVNTPNHILYAKNENRS